MSDEPRPTNFYEWWAAYSRNEERHVTGGSEWLASFAAWEWAKTIEREKIEAERQLLAPREP